ncbi:MAG TPA: DUF1028 domain-containing protein, partial [Bacteroidales bacterium]|nr:DUF1028 domain-containing protein [Bacteroidales bacterium]
KTKSLLLIALLFAAFSLAYAQDTFSIVAIDTVTGEVGSAGASCVDMNSFPGYDDDFLGELFPNVGAINTQAYYHATNQANARARMNEGYTPGEIIDWLIENDVQNNPNIRQYGIVAFVDGSPESAAHTGIQTNDYKGHNLGPNFSIQGNILLGQQILDSMEARFLNAEGDLACKLMAALQGAQGVGADTRCASNGTSSLFAFVKVAQPDDIFGSPSFLVSVRTSQNAGIEPIDSLQVLFDLVHECSSVGVPENDGFNANYTLYPNPSSSNFTLIQKSAWKQSQQVVITDVTGKMVYQNSVSGVLKIDASHFPSGIYIMHVSGENTSYSTKLIRK